MISKQTTNIIKTLIEEGIAPSKDCSIKLINEIENLKEKVNSMEVLLIAMSLSLYGEMCSTQFKHDSLFGPKHRTCCDKRWLFDEIQKTLVKLREDR